MPSTTPPDTQQLQNVLLEKILPRVQARGVAGLFIAHPSWESLQKAAPALPDGAAVTPKPLRGKRVRGRNLRTHGNMGVEEFRWPQDKLLSVRVPKLCFATEGPIGFQIADYVLHCSPGHGILLPPGTPFPDGALSVLDEARPHHNACEMLMLLPRQGSLSCWSSRQWFDEPRKMLQRSVSCSVPQSQVTPLLHQLVDETTRRQLHWETIGSCLLQAALSLLHRELQELPVIHADNAGDALRAAPRREVHAITRAEEYIRGNLRWPLTIEQVARAVYLSRTTFIEQFRARTGKSFVQYVNDCRFERSCQLLEGSDLSIEHISLQVGIKARSLRLLIRQRTGLSPTALRHRYRQSAK